jgi:hypothetical protein
MKTHDEYVKHALNDMSLMDLAHCYADMKVALAAITERKWKNGRLKELAAAALAGGDISKELE